MPVDIEKIRDAFDKFEDKDFTGAKEILQQEIRAAKETFLNNKLDVGKDVMEDGKKKKKVVVKEETKDE